MSENAKVQGITEINSKVLPIGYTLASTETIVESGKDIKHFKGILNNDITTMVGPNNIKRIDTTISATSMYYIDSMGRARLRISQKSNLPNLRNDWYIDEKGNKRLKKSELGKSPSAFKKQPLKSLTFKEANSLLAPIIYDKNLSLNQILFLFQKLLGPLSISQVEAIKILQFAREPYTKKEKQCMSSMIMAIKIAKVDLFASWCSLNRSERNANSGWIKDIFNTPLFLNVEARSNYHYFAFNTNSGEFIDVSKEYKYPSGKGKIDIYLDKLQNVMSNTASLNITDVFTQFLF